MRAELSMTLKRGESLLLILAIPLVLLVFFSKVHVVNTKGSPVDFFTPGILALAVMSSAMVNLAIATGFERSTGVLKRLGGTPLRRWQLLGAKFAAVALLELVQTGLVLGLGAVLGWSASGDAGLVVAGVIVGSCAFAGLGMLMAGNLGAYTTLALANGLYIVLLLLGGMVVPLHDLPSQLADVARLLPSAALSQVLRGALETTHAGFPLGAWVTLLIWAVVAPLLASLSFKWDP